MYIQLDTKDFNMYLLKIIILFGFSIYIGGGSVIKNPNNYGPYVMAWRNYQVCNGPKTKNVTEVSTYFAPKNDKSVAQINITFLDDTHIDEMRIAVYTSQINTKTLLWNYKIKDPCQHFTFANIIREQTKAKNCVVPQGFYCSTLNLSDISKSFFGSSFFYGDYVLKVITLSNRGNIGCLIMEAAFMRPTKT